VATISSLLADHVTLQVRSVDRLFLQGYVPRLMTEGQVIRFLLDRGFPIPSPVVLGRIGRDYVNRVNAYIAANEIPTVRFVEGDVKEEIAREHCRYGSWARRESVTRPDRLRSSPRSQATANVALQYYAVVAGTDVVDVEFALGELQEAISGLLAEMQSLDRGATWC